jgi:hypothetical protein
MSVFSFVHFIVSNFVSKLSKKMMTDADKILQLTNDGLDVFRHYLGANIGTLKSFRNPYREDSTASCHLYYHQQQYGGGSRYYLHDFGDSNFHGDCFWLVGNICHLDVRSHFKEIVEIIDRDLGLYALNSTKDAKIPAVTYQPKVVVTPPVTTKKNLRYSCISREMTPSDMAYWSRYGITKDILKRYHVTSLKRYTSERSVEQPGVKRTFSIFPSAASPLFGYQFQESGGIKIYHPHSQVRFLYGGKLPDPYIFGKEQLNKSFARKKVVYITGGEKDVMSLASHGFDAVSFNSETYKLTPSDIQDLLKRYENVGLLYDSDETGIRESKTMLENFQDLPVFRVQLPLSGTKEEKDISDFFAMGHLSSELERLTRYALDDLKKKEQYQQTVI